jgi:hypothetical protein
LTGAAVKVTDVPAQIAPEGAAEILTLTGRFELTAIVMVLEVAGLPWAQVSDEVNTTVTLSLLASVEEVKVLLFVPTLPPFTFH